MLHVKDVLNILKRSLANMIIYLVHNGIIQLPKIFYSKAKAINKAHNFVNGYVEEYDARFISTLNRVEVDKLWQENWNKRHRKIMHFESLIKPGVIACDKSKQIKDYYKLNNHVTNVRANVTCTKCLIHIKNVYGGSPDPNIQSTTQGL